MTESKMKPGADLNSSPLTFKSELEAKLMGGIS